MYHARFFDVAYNIVILINDTKKICKWDIRCQLSRAQMRQIRKCVHLFYSCMQVTSPLPFHQCCSQTINRQFSGDHSRGRSGWNVPSIALLLCNIYFFTRFMLQCIQSKLLISLHRQLYDIWQQFNLAITTSSGKFLHLYIEYLRWMSSE